MEFFETGTTELCNLKQDIEEKYDLAASHSEKVDEMLKMLRAWQAETNADICETLNPDFDPHYVPTAEDEAGKIGKQGEWSVLTKEKFLARHGMLADKKGVEFRSDQSRSHV